MTRTAPPHSRIRQATIRFALVLLAGLPGFLPPVAAQEHRAGPYVFEGVSRVVVVPDVHGAHRELIGLLEAATIIDSAGAWIGGTTHLVSLGDLMDRGTDTRRVLDLFMRLEREAEAAGGQVHVLLGNHEVMNLSRELEYVARAEYDSWRDLETAEQRSLAKQRVATVPAGEAAFDERFPPGYFGRAAALSPDGHYGRWLLSRPVAVNIDGTLFVHGGLPPLLAETDLTPLNQLAAEALGLYARSFAELESAGVLDGDVAFAERASVARTRLGVAKPDDSTRESLERTIEALEAAAGSPVLGPAGPLWYRGSALCNPVREIDIAAAALQKLGARRAVVGHSVVTDGRVRTRLDGRVTLLDTGMLQSAYAGRPSALVITAAGDAIVQTGEGSETAQPEPEPRRVGARPGRLDDDALEQLLAYGEVVGEQQVPGGVEVTLRSGALQVRALVLAARGWQRDIAAYQLDRALGLEMIPVTVAREFRGRPAALQFRPERASTLRQLEGGIRSNWCQVADQMPLLLALDELLNNPVRNRDSVLVAADDGRLIAVGHAAAFGTSSGRLAHVERQPWHIGAEFGRRLRNLTATGLEARLGPWLTPAQVSALLRRRDDLLQNRLQEAQKTNRARNATLSETWIAANSQGTISSTLVIGR